MEPKSQVEIQLGHMCNNRCVFCASGQRTAMGAALPLEAEPILAEIRAARASGHRKLTLLGGEPTLQPSFMTVVKEAVALGFEEIVLFTNGAKTARDTFVDEILATGGNFTFRFSVQGATKASHELTTMKVGSFDRIVRSMQHVAARNRKLTVNMCVVSSNFEEVDQFPALLTPLGAGQLHLDMMRPLDAGDRTDAELRATIPHYSALAAPMRRMIHGFPEGFDVNIGNLPYCIAPDLAPWIHHDGEHTLTISVDDDKTLSKPWDKYFTKRRDKFKPQSCDACVFYDRCSGVFETYAEIYGLEELIPVTALKLREVDPALRLFSTHVRQVVKGLAGFTPPAPFTKLSAFERSESEVALTFEAPSPLVLTLVKVGSRADFAFRTELFDAVVQTAPASAGDVLRALDALALRLRELGHAVTVPPSQDAIVRVAPTIAARLQRLRRSAPFAAVTWASTLISLGGQRAELVFSEPGGASATLWFAEQDGRPSGGYALQGDVAATPPQALVEGLRAVMGALRAAPAATLPANPPPR